MIVNIQSDAFPALESGVRARWAPIFLSPIRGSDERLVIGIAVVSERAFHIEAANALDRLRCLYLDQADIVIQVTGIVLDHLRSDLATRGLQALTDYRPVVTGVSLGTLREGEGVSLESIGVSWMKALSSLYDTQGSGVLKELDDADESFEAQYEALSGIDRLPKLVLEYVSSTKQSLEVFFRPDLSGRQRRRRSHEVSIDFSGSRLVANFGTLQSGQIARSVGLIKRRLWDLKVQRDSEKDQPFSRSHEMLIQMPSENDPQITERQFENIHTALVSLEQQADQEELRLEAFTSVADIGQRVLDAELA